MGDQHNAVAAGAPRTIIDKIWDARVIVVQEDECLLWVDRHYVHEGSHHAFAQLAKAGAPAARPDLTFGFADHYIPTRPASGVDGVRMVDLLAKNTAAQGIRNFGAGDARQGIAHVVAPELGLTLPGLVIVCGDSHTSTHGALGAFAFGIGASEVAHVLQTQTIWQSRPRRMLIEIGGVLPEGVTAKDLAIHLVARLGADFAVGHAIEYGGDAIRALSIEGRMTLCNMSIEMGSRLGIISPDERLFAWLAGRPGVPSGEDFSHAVESWRALATDPGAVFDHVVHVDAREVEPSVTWGVSPEHAAPLSGCAPDPSGIPDPLKSAAAREALAYMGLEPGTKLKDVAIDRVFIGSCTNGRIEDLRAAADILRGRRTRISGLVSPGSTRVRLQAEAEGLDRVFTEAGLEWAGSGCSLCVGMNGDLLNAGERCASTTNRNFRGRQGKGSRTHLVSPAVAAASAVTGRLTHPADLGAR